MAQINEQKLSNRCSQIRHGRQLGLTLIQVRSQTSLGNVLGLLLSLLMYLINMWQDSQMNVCTSMDFVRGSLIRFYISCFEDLGVQEEFFMSWVILSLVFIMSLFMCAYIDQIGTRIIFNLYIFGVIIIIKIKGYQPPNFITLIFLYLLAYELIILSHHK